VLPGRAVPLDAYRIHGISDAMLAGAPSPADVAGSFRASFGDDTLAIHNASFDLPFLRALLRRHGHPPVCNPVIDTLGLARGLYGSGGNSLGELVLRLGIARPGAHRALDDARATAELLLRLARRWETERAIGSLAELAAASQDALRLPGRRGPRPTANVDSDTPAGSRMEAIDMTMPEVGQLAPEFRLKGPGGQYTTLSEYRGRQIVLLVFYPLAFSPVCSHQLPDIQKRLEELRALDVVVFGASVDSHYANEAFARSLRIDFPLLSDFKRQAMTAYGVLDTERGYSMRATFAVGKDGRIAYREVAANASDMDQIPSLDRLLEVLKLQPR
jgi:peroxiredoxin/DNA polymerase III epsilon subunit-like protein